MSEACLQESFSPHGRCFGCGPANPDGLHLRSFPRAEEVVAQWQPTEKYQAFPGMLNGGIIGALLDCHSNWTAAWHLMKVRGADVPPCTVTSKFEVKLRRPTPLVPVRLVARVAEAQDDRCVIEAELVANGEVTARCTG